MEGFFLYNQAEQLMEQYPLTVTETAKGRGALICITECGEKILKEYKGSAVRAEILHDVAEYLNKAGIKTDGIIKTTEGAFLSGNAEEGFYLLKDWYSGRECVRAAGGSVHHLGKRPVPRHTGPGGGPRLL